MTKLRLRELLDKKKRSFKEDKELKNFQNAFISKAKVNPRLFDNNFEKISSRKKYSGICRRNDGKQQ